MKSTWIGSRAIITTYQFNGATLAESLRASQSSRAHLPTDTAIKEIPVHDIVEACQSLYGYQMKFFGSEPNDRVSRSIWRGGLPPSPLRCRLSRILHSSLFPSFIAHKDS